VFFVAALDPHRRAQGGGGGGGGGGEKKQKNKTVCFFLGDTGIIFFGEGGGGQGGGKGTASVKGHLILKGLFFFGGNYKNQRGPSKPGPGFQNQLTRGRGVFFGWGGWSGRGIRNLGEWGAGGGGERPKTGPKKFRLFGGGGAGGGLGGEFDGGGNKANFSGVFLGAFFWKTGGAKKKKNPLGGHKNFVKKVFFWDWRIF